MGSAGDQFTACMRQQGVKAVVFDFDCTISIKHSGGRVRAEKLDAFLQDNISPCFQQVGEIASLRLPNCLSNCVSTRRVRRVSLLAERRGGLWWQVSLSTVSPSGQSLELASPKHDEHIPRQLLPKLLASDMKIGVATFADAHKSPATHGLHLQNPSPRAKQNQSTSKPILFFCPPSR
jgi:hypothetical protein